MKFFLTKFERKGTSFLTNGNITREFKYLKEELQIWMIYIMDYLSWEVKVSQKIQSIT